MITVCMCWVIILCMCTFYKHKIHTTQHQYTSHTVQHKWDTIDYNWLLDRLCETLLTTLRHHSLLDNWHHWLLGHHSETPLTAWPSLWDTTDCLTITLTQLTTDHHSDTTDCLTVTLNTINCLHCCLLELILSSKSQVVYASSCPYVN